MQGEAFWKSSQQSSLNGRNVLSKPAKADAAKLVCSCDSLAYGSLYVFNLQYLYCDHKYKIVLN